MIGAGKIVAERFAGKFSQEDCSGIAHFCHGLKRVRGHDLKMFGCDSVDGLDCLIQILRDKNISVIFQRF